MYLCFLISYYSSNCFCLRMQCTEQILSLSFEMNGVSAECLSVVTGSMFCAQSVCSGVQS